MRFKSSIVKRPLQVDQTFCDPIPGGCCQQGWPGQPTDGGEGDC